MTSPGHAQSPDGLRAWQSAVVRLWSASDDAFATLTLTWLPNDRPGGPWIVSLECGDAGEGWSETVKIAGAPTLQTALHRLWARINQSLLNDSSAPLPADYADDAWLTADEIALLDRLMALMQSRQPIGMQLVYRPELGLSSQWIAVLHDLNKEPPEPIMNAIHAEHLARVCELLIELAGT
ncbi:MAG: hypothetical protein IT324_12885 [Anaerolineae bacterium]|nr:hypothetical protein [Anaerolineae bacterium]